ncbi:hypothetical protein WJT74_05970 [Sphingomicrobium sp. XHP0239]|uniref:hypothetical protein n=1 Tax=Sphingomicrobium maritimum TaxID=3133972 RepID=UPI0031CCD20B
MHDVHDLDVPILARIVQAMYALERAGLTPVASEDLQAFIYLANVLSPQWGVAPIEGSVLKEVRGPQSLVVAEAVDFCVGQGIIQIGSLLADSSDPTILAATYYLNPQGADQILQPLRVFPDEEKVFHFLQELAFAFALIENDKRDEAAEEDASWTDPAVSINRVVDFAEFVSPLENPTANTLYAFQQFAPEGVTYTPSETMALYLRLLDRRAYG